MLEQLEILRHSVWFELERIDVDEEDGLHTGYGNRVPVLEDREGNRLCQVFLDPATVMNYLRGA
jgi:uncharacterized protein YecE (DUF72 family)